MKIVYATSLALLLATGSVYADQTVIGGATQTEVGLSDAPIDGSTYGRNNGAWSAIPGGGDMLSTSNLSDVQNAATARTNLGVLSEAEIDAADDTGTDDQTITDFSITDGILSITIESGNTSTVDVSDMVGGSDDQTITDLSLDGTTISITLEDGNTKTLDIGTITGDGDITSVTVGSGLTGGATSGDATVGVDATYMQRRVTGECPVGQSIRVIYADGTVDCEFDDGSGSTNLTNSTTATTLTVISSAGADTILPAATATDAGIMTAEMQAKLASMDESASNDQTGAEIKAAYEAEADTNAFTDSEKTKLAGVATAATANSADAYLLSRLNQTDTQPASTISDFDTEVANNIKVLANTDKVSFDATSSSKLAAIEDGATADQHASEVVATPFGTIAATTVQGQIEEIANEATGANLGNTPDADSVLVTSSSGTNTDIPAATTSVAGVMSASDKATLDALDAETTTVTPSATNVVISPSHGDDITLPAATLTLAGILLPAEKIAIGEIVDSKAGTGIEFDDSVDGEVTISVKVTDLIDDTAGDGDTAKIWSVDKAFDLLGLKADKADLANQTAFEAAFFDLPEGGTETFAFDTYPTCKTSAHSSGLAADGANFAHWGGTQWYVNGADSLSACVTTYTMTLNVVDDGALGSGVTVDGSLRTLAGSPYSIEGLSSATEAITYVGSNLMNCAGTAVTGTANTGPWVVDMSDSHETVTCTETAAGTCTPAVLLDQTGTTAANSSSVDTADKGYAIKITGTGKTLLSVKFKTSALAGGTSTAAMVYVSESLDFSGALVDSQSITTPGTTTGTEFEVTFDDPQMLDNGTDYYIAVVDPDATWSTRFNFALISDAVNENYYSTLTGYNGFAQNLNNYSIWAEVKVCD